ncbi:MAG TPA: bifunctional phosphoribosyl-AMP cyclohydrolase/phosphoribosyl-ATP diphosphatase HisIE [Xanthomonadales bacterium]|nr:bifunctional phosphoribosyl-AMP cyclohydrolase/phosphoribosyl-ATP diphosphatase HisIE [Xanthomonadales bacterium]
MLDRKTLDWKKMNGLMPVVVQDSFDGRVLMQAYMNEQALEATLESGHITFWSRSRETLWTKGETSGNRLELVSIHADCDGDCLLAMANPLGPTCHLGTDTCFDGETQVAPKLAFLAKLETVIARRDAERPADSYTTSLLESGPKRIAQKVGEEGVETALAGASGDREELLAEAADLIFHTLVLMRTRDATLGQLLETLTKRHQG